MGQTQWGRTQNIVTPVLKSHLWDKEKKKWSFTTGDLLKVVQFIWNYLWPVLKSPLGLNNSYEILYDKIRKRWPLNRGDLLGMFDCILTLIGLFMAGLTFLK